MPVIPFPLFFNPITQKAQSFVHLFYIRKAFGLHPPSMNSLIVPGLSALDADLKWVSFPVFGRPCPLKPRHGFVNSKSVDSWREVVIMIQRAARADPTGQSELILTAPLTAKFSGVATNAGVTWGPGNDSVTSGTSPNLTVIPIKNTSYGWRTAVKTLFHSRFHGEFKTPDYPYLELVEENGTVQAVQVRDGPKQPEGHNYVPSTVVVRRLIRANASIELLDWERRIESIHPGDGSVVSAVGMSLASHFCVHAIAKGVPVVTDEHLQVGHTLEATKNQPDKLRKIEYTAMAKAIRVALAGHLDLLGKTEEHERDAILTAIATIQAQFAWGRTQALCRFRALAAAILLKAVYASCCGELRHWTAHRSGPEDGEPEMAEHVDIISQKRATIYARAFKESLTSKELEFRLTVAAKDFGHSGWQGSFGGRCWIDVANIGSRLAAATTAFNGAPNKANWAHIVQAANLLINTSHNSGKCLTKWVKSNALDGITNSPSVGFLNHFAGTNAQIQGATT